MSYFEDFPKISADDKAFLESKGTIRRFEKGWPVIHQDHDSEAFFLIRKGEVEVSCKMNGERTLLGRLGPDSFFGELGVLTRTKRSASVTALTDCEFTVLTRKQFTECLEQRPSTALALIPPLVSLIHTLTERLNMHALDAYQRLRIVMNQLKVKTDHGDVVTPWTQEDLGDMVNCTRENVNLKFRELRKGGYIRTDRKRKQIVILKTLPERF